jgi:hypothetical protein
MPFYKVTFLLANQNIIISELQNSDDDDISSYFGVLMA